MASLEQMSKVLNKTTDDLNAYTKVFNNAAQSVIGDTEAMGRSAVDLREQLNKLLSDAQGLNKLGKDIDINDKGQVEGFVAKIKELDKTLSDLSPVIAENIKAMNTAFQREFKLDDGTTGYLKEQLNDLRALFKDDILKIDVSRLAPDLSSWADNFVDQVNKIEYAMGRLTEFGKKRNETEKALGFVVDRKDVAPIQEYKHKKLSDYDKQAREFGYKGISDRQYLRDFPDAAEDIESINTYIKQLDDVVGKKIKGYVELFNDAQNLLKGGQSNQELYETIGSPMDRSLYGDNIDWNKMTSLKFKDLQSGLGGDDEFFSDKVDESVNKTAESVTKVGEASTKATNSIRNYAEELNKLVETDTVLNNEQKQGILGQDFSDKVKKYREDITYFKNQLQSLGNTKLTDMPATQLDPNKTEDFTSLTNYKSRINAAIDSLETLKNEQNKLFSDLSDPASMSKLIGTGISEELFGEVKSVLESGYKVNLIDGSADKEKLDQLRKGFEQLISEFKGYNINIVPDNDIEDLAKIDALQKAINSESRRQAETAQAQANYERDKAKYLEQYNKIAQAQANIKALEDTRNSLMNGASKNDKKAISERYKTEINNNKSIIDNAEKVINKYKSEFTAHNLEIPVTPVVKANANLSGQFRSEFMGLKASGRNEILGGLSSQDETIAKLNKQAQEFGININKISTRLSAMSNTIKTAFYSGDIDRARSLLGAYANEVDKLRTKIEGQSKAQDIAKERQRQAAQETERNARDQARAAAEQAMAQQEAIRSLMEETKNYVSTQEALSGQKMSFSEQAAYYDQQANKMKQLAGESKEYIEILKLKRQAEAKAADEAKRAAEIEKKAQEDAVKAARDRVTNTLGTIKKIADGVNNAVNKIVSIIRNGINLINKVFSTIGKFVGRITTGAKAIVSLFGSLSNRVRGTAGNSGRLNGSFNILAGTATELRSKIMLLKGAFDTLFNNQMVKKAENLMASVYSLKNIAGSGVTKEVLDWANSMEYAFGISAKELIGDINELTGVLYGLGMTAEDTAVGSENLLMMSRYLAFMGAAGGDTSVVMNKLVSGMKGMTQAIDDLGLSVRDAQMDSFLESLKAQGGEFANISTDFSSLNEEARVYVRYAALINQFTKNYDITNFAKALDTVTGRMQIMKQTAASLVTTIGTGLAKAISKLAIFIVPLLKTIESAVSKIFAFFGIDVSMTTDINEGTDAVGGLNDSLDKTKDNLDEVDKKSKKAKGSLQSFDRVNNVTSSSSSKGSGSGSDGFDYKKLMTSMLGDLNALAAEASKSFADKMQEKMQEALKTAWDNFVKYAKKITGRDIIDLGFDWKSIKQSLKTIWKNIKTLISSWGTFVIEIGIKFLDDINIGKIITKFLEFTSAVTDLAVAFSEVLIPVLRNFYDEVLSPIVKLVGEKIVDAFDKAIEKVKAWTKYLQDNKPELIEEWTEKLKHFFNVVTGKESANPEDGAIGTVLEILNKIGKVIKALIPIVSDLASALGVFLKEEFLPWLNEKLGELAKWLSENKDDIVKFLKEIAGFVWDSFKVFVDLISKLVDFCVKHPTAVKVFLEGLVAIKIASWAASSAAGIGQLVFQLQLLSKLGGITKALGGIGTAATATSTELATVGAAGGTAAKKSVLSKVLGKTGSLASVESADGAVLSSYMMGGSGVLGGLAKFGTFMGSGATTAGGVATAGASSIAGIVGGIAGIGDGIKDLYDASKETNEEIKEQKNWSGGTKIGMVGAGAATGATIGSVVPGVGTAVGAAVGAGVSGVAAIFKGSDISEWLHDAWDNTLKPFFTESIPEAFGKLVEGLKTFFTETVPTTVSNIGTGISTFFTETVPGFFSNLWEGIKTFFTETVPQTISNIADSISTFFTETVPGFFGNLIDGVVQFFTEDVPYALGYIAGSLKVFFTETIPGFFGGLWKDIKTFFTETIPTALETITEKATTFLTETIPGFFKGLWKDIKKLFKETIPTALETISTKATTFLTETIPGFFKGLWKDIKTFFTETIPTALETIVTKATTFLTVTIPGFFGSIWKSIKTFFTETIPTALETIETKATTFLTVTIPHFFGSIWKSLRKFFTETIPTAISTVQTGIKTFFTETIPNKIKSVLDGIGDIFDGAVGWVKSKFSSIGSNFSAGYNSAVKKTSAKSAKKVTSHAVGGSIAGGQLFIANENGGAELVGDITGASGAQVANNGMIIKAMTDGVFTGVYNALAEASNQRSNAGGMTTNAKIEINGFGLIDSSTLRELARLLAPYNNSNNTNIADVNFSI